MHIRQLDHLVLTVRDLEATCAFYRDIPGMEVVHSGDRTSLHSGTQKINLHEQGHKFLPKAHQPTPGSADLCFITDVPLPDVAAHLALHKVPILEGPVER